jgi:flagellar biosynthesis chaperone FliJ
MGFRFALAGLLRVRENLEKQRWRERQRIARHLSSIRGEIESLEIMHSAQQRMRMQQLASGVRAAELQFWRECEAIYSRQQKELETKLREVERNDAEARDRFQRARLDREVVSKMRDRAYEAYRREFARREQIAADEDFIVSRLGRD